MHAPDLRMPAIKSAPEYAFDAIREQVQAVEQTIVEGEDLLGMFASFGIATSIAIRTIALEGQVLVFNGLDDAGREVHLIQHYTQVSILLVKDKSNKPRPRPIGFIHADG